MPSPELTAILQQAMSPCPHFEGVCAGHSTWHPEVGHIPRGFAGANGSSESVQLILVNAEPGNPADGEQYADASTGWVADHAAYYESLLETNLLRRSGRPAPFHRNLRKILDLFWPNEALAAQLEKTWITDAVLCSAKFSGGPIARAVENMCVTNYLARQIAVLPNAFIVTLGGKAARRLQRQNLHIHYLAQHPSARPNTSPEASWQRAAASFHAWLELAEADAQLERI